MSRKLMLTSLGSYADPAEKYCFKACASCLRCVNKGTKSACGGCSGRIDPKGQRHPDRDDYCDCSRGVFRWVTKDGQYVIRQINPHGGSVTYEGNSQDEQDWNQVLNEYREQYDNETFDPVTINGKSATDWYNRQKGA